MTGRRYLMLGLELVLVSYFSWRSYDFITASLAYLDPAVKILIGVVYVIATDVSYLLWRHVAAPGATTHRQHQVADAMAWLLMIMTVITSCGDVLLHNTIAVIDTSSIAPVLLFLPVATVAVNLIGLKLYEDNDAEQLETMAQRAAEYSEVDAGMEIYRQAVRQVSQSRAELAAKLAPHIAQDINRKVSGRVYARLPQTTPPPAAPTVKHELPPPALPVAARSNGNGQHAYNSEVTADLPKDLT